MNEILITIALSCIYMLIGFGVAKLVSKATSTPAHIVIFIFWPLVAIIYGMMNE